VEQAFERDLLRRHQALDDAKSLLYAWQQAIKKGM
jgi:hypothetical protein